MSLRFFSDQCVPREINQTLRDHGHDVVELRDVLPIKSPDEVVIERARELDRILLSLNGDFSDIVAYPPANNLGIISIQLHNHPEIIPALMKRLLEYADDHSEQSEYVGKLLIVEVHRIRIRR